MRLGVAGVDQPIQNPAGFKRVANPFPGERSQMTRKAGGIAMRIGMGLTPVR